MPILATKTHSRLAHRPYSPADQRDTDMLCPDGLGRLRFFHRISTRARGAPAPPPKNGKSGKVSPAAFAV